MGGSCVSVVCEGTSISLIMILRMALFFCLGTINLVQGAISDGDKKGYTDSMNDFTQDFLAVSWDGLGDNYVFSPFSVHSVLAMLTTGATQSSKTQKQLVAGFGKNVWAICKRLQEPDRHSDIWQSSVDYSNIFS